MPLKNWCSIHERLSKSCLKHSLRFCGISNFKTEFYCISRPHCIFEIHQLWQSDFSRVCSNCCCSCSFEHEVVTLGQSSHNMYSNSILNFQESTTILNAHTKKFLKLIVCTSNMRLYTLNDHFSFITIFWFLELLFCLFFALSAANKRSTNKRTWYFTKKDYQPR